MALPPGTPAPEPDKRQVAQSDALLREVDDAVRQDEFAYLAKKYGVAVGIAVLIGLAAFAGWLWWTERQEAGLERSSEELVMAVDSISQGRADSAARAFASLAGNGEGGTKVVARLAEAGIATEQGRPGDAAKIYAEVAADSAAPQVYRDFATVREVLLRYDDMKPAEVEARLKPLAVPGAAWFGSAGELLGHAYLDQGKEDQAGALFRTIATDEKVPESIRFRARQMAGSMGVDAIEDVDKTLEELRGAGSGAGAQP